MTSGPPKQQVDVFLGTADIIARVKMAQSRPVTRAFVAMRRYLVMMGAALMALGVMVLGYRGFVAQQRHHGNAMLADTDAPLQEQDAQAVPAPVTMPPAQRLAPRVTAQPVKIIIQQQPAAIWLDGTKLADKKRGWSGKLSPGNHQLAVRVGGRMMRHTFVVEADALAIAVNPKEQSFEVTSGGKAHRSSRSHGN